MTVTLKCIGIFLLMVLCSFNGIVWDNEENTSAYEWQTKEFSFETPVPIKATCSYPVFIGASLLISVANDHIQSDVENRILEWCKESLFEDEAEEVEFSYRVTPVYQTPYLISCCGCQTRIWGYRGSTRYFGDDILLRWRICDQS